MAIPSRQIGWSQESKLLWQLQQIVAKYGKTSAYKAYPSLASFPLPGSPNTLYLALDTSKIYYWDEGTSSYVEVSAGITSVGLTMPAAFAVANSPLTANGTINVTGAGLISQYVRGDGSLSDFPGSTGGGASVNYYFNGGTSQGTFGGDTYYEMSKVADTGAAANFSISADGYVAQFLTDAGDPNLLQIPGGAWDIELYMNADSAGGTPNFYVELYKYDGVTFTLLGSSSGNPEFITNGTSVDLYYTSVAVPTTTLLLTDRLAMRVYVNHSGKTITLYTQDNTLALVQTTFTSGLTAINGLTAQVQFLGTGTTGTDFNIVSAGATHTFNIPTASALNRGLLSSADWTTFNNKPSVNLYTGDGTLTAARTITQGGFNLTFTGSSFTNRFTAAGRLLLGTTTESTYILDIVGSMRLVTASATVGALFQNTAATTQYVEIKCASGQVSQLRLTSAAANLGWSLSQIAGNFLIGAQPDVGGPTYAITINRTNGNTLLYNSSTISYANSVSLLELSANNKGFLPTRMTETQLKTIAGAVSSVSIVNGGSGYNNGTFNNVPATVTSIYGTGTIAVSAVVSGGVVISLTMGAIPPYGSGYQIGDIITSFTGLSGGVNFQGKITGVTTPTALIGYQTNNVEALSIHNSQFGWVKFLIDKGQLQLRDYLTTTSFTGTLVGYLGFDATGNILTAAAPTAANIYNTDGTLTGDRVVTLGLNNLTFDGSAGGDIIYSDATNIQLGSVTGTKFGTTTAEKLAFYGLNPIAQQTTSVTAGAFVQNSTNAVYQDSTFSGYTVGQVVEALRFLGLLA